MRTPRVLIVSAVLLLLSRPGFTAEVTLPAPVLEWSFYILLIFAVCVGIGIFLFMKGKTWPGDSLGSLLDEQHPVIHSVRPDASVVQCVNQMNEHRIGAILVIEDGVLLGIFTERDAITRVLGGGLDPASTDVSDVMTKQPVCVSTSTSLEEAMSIVTYQHIRHLPVVEDGTVLGLVSSGDLTHRLLEN